MYIISKFRFRFQSESMTKKPLSNDLIQPFLYIEKVMKKRTVDQINSKRGKQKEFVIPKAVKKSSFPEKVKLEVP